MNTIASFLGKTFLIERFFGVLLYATVVGVSYIALRQAKTTKQFKKVINICLFLLCIMAFFYVPPETADLYRIRTYITAWERVNYEKWASVYLTNTNAPGAYYLYFLMSRIKIEGLLPAIACFVVFGNLFHILKKESEIERSSNHSLATAFLYLMAQGLFLGVISGIRNGMAFSLVARAMYDDFCLGKNKLINCFLCLIAVSLHISSVPMVALYLLFTIYHSWHESGILTKLYSFACVLGVIYWTVRTKSSLIDIVISKAETYTSSRIYSYVWEQIIVSVAVFLLILVLLAYRRHYKKSELKTMYIISSVLTIGVLLMLKSYTMFHRYANFTMYISLPIIANCLDKESDVERYRTYKCVKYISLLIFALACVRGDLCGYKFFVI